MTWTATGYNEVAARAWLSEDPRRQEAALRAVVATHSHGSIPVEFLSDCPNCVAMTALELLTEHAGPS